MQERPYGGIGGDPPRINEADRIPCSCSRNKLSGFAKIKMEICLIKNFHARKHRLSGPLNRASPLMSRRDLSNEGTPCLYVTVFSNLNAFFTDFEISAKAFISSRMTSLV